MIKKLAVLMAALLIPLSITMTASPAHATLYVDGCLSNGQTASERLDVFDGDTVGVPAWDVSDAKYRLTARLHYFYCFDNRPDHPNRVFPNEVKFCAEKLTDQQPWTGTPLRSFVFDPYFFTLDGNTTVDPGAYILSWDGVASKGATKCTPYQGISAADQHWLNQGNRPAWTVNGHVDIKYAPDRDIEFHDVNTGSRAHLFHPSEDEIINI